MLNVSGGENEFLDIPLIAGGFFWHRMVVHMHGDRGYHRRVIRSSLVDLQDGGKLKIESRSAILGERSAFLSKIARPIGERLWNPSANINSRGTY